MKLYSFPLSGHAHRARLFLSLLGVEYSLVHVDLAVKENQTPEFLQVNPFGQVPVLEDDGEVICDSVAILVYLAKKYGNTDWLPETPAAAARVQRWLSVASGEILRGPGSARLITLFGYKLDAADTMIRAHAILKLVDQALEGQDWLVAGTHPTLADVALYSYIASSPEGNVDLSGYSHVLAWLARVEALPGFEPFPRTAIGLFANA